MPNRTCIRLAAALGFCLTGLAPALHGQWTAPTPEELAMTSLPEVPGAPAVLLYKEETTEDALHMRSAYVRLKVLTDKGKEYANVELPYVTGEDGSSVDSIGGRTIHPDGTIIPFSGKPYDKLIGKEGDYKVKSKVFTLPSVEVGSIIEYRYKIRIGDQYFASPDWYIQSELFLRKGHYMWKPTGKDLYNDKGDIVSGNLAWTPILPQGTTLKNTTLPTGQIDLELDVHDIPPIPHEEYMPPIDSLSYRVMFYYTPYASMGEFWTSTGKNWSKNADKFIGPSSGVTDYVRSIVQPTDTQDQKARKLYAAVMALENTDYTRERTTSEERAEGFKNVKSSEDVLKRKRGTSDQLTELFIGMARAAGLKAYLMGVSDRSRRIFLQSYTSMRQIDDYIAIVNIDGKDVYFDPGERYCEPEHLAWNHTYAGGIRQTDGGIALVRTPYEAFKFSHVGRVAVVTLDEHGDATGTVSLSFSGDPALRWRHTALRGDESALKDDLRMQMEHMLPGGIDVKVTDVKNLTDYDKPLEVKYEIKGPIGSSTGKRLLVPADLFESNEKPKFPESKREISIDMHYSSMEQDAVRYIFPAGIAVESVPTAETELMKKTAGFETFNRSTPTSVTIYRNLTIGVPIFGVEEYPELRTFYSKLETKDQEPVVLTHAAPAAAIAKPAGN